MRWSIRTKIMTVLSALLLIVVVAYLVVAERVFRDDKELQVFDSNRTSTQQLAGELEGSLRRVVDKMEILAQLAVHNRKTTLPLESSFFEADPGLVLFPLILPRSKKKVDPQSFTILRELVSKKKLADLRLTSDEIHDPFILPMPEYIKEVTDGVQIENRSTKSNPLYLVSIPVEIRSNDPGAPTVRAKVRAIVDARGWLERLRSHSSLAFSFAVGPDGILISYPRTAPIMARKDMSSLDPVKLALSQRFSSQQLEFEMEGKKFLGLYQKTDLGSLIVISMTEKSTALAARGLLLEKTIYLSLFILTGAFLVSLFFASSLSNPVLRLVHATREIAQGNFDADVPIDTGDEIGILAKSFSEMGQELKSSRQLLEKYNAELEEKVKVRTQELESRNADIRRQQEALIQASRLAAVGEIAGHAAHEVLNPLTAMISRIEAISTRVSEFSSSPRAPFQAFRVILQAWRSEFDKGGLTGWSDAMREPSKVYPGKSMIEEDVANLISVSKHFDDLSQQLGGDLELLLTESHRIGRIVDGMRGLSRPSQTKRRQDLKPLIAECVRVSEDLLAKHNVRIDTQLAGNSAWVNVDADEMKQVFSNLIKNSLDAVTQAHQDRPGGIIRITTSATNGQFCIRIWDNGSGIAPEDSAKLFEAHFSTKGTEGTGFGLSICRRFVRQAGGELLLIASEPGCFTEFGITLPLDDALEDTAV